MDSAGRGQVNAGAAEEFQQQNGLVIAIRKGPPRSLKIGDSLRQLRARHTATPGGFQNAGAEIFGNELEFVRREAAGKAPRPGTERSVSTSNKRGDQIVTLGNHTES